MRNCWPRPSRLEPAGEGRNLAESEAWLAREDAAMGRVHCIRFYPLVMVRAQGYRLRDATAKLRKGAWSAPGLMEAVSFRNLPSRP
jgi:hypothetical protein